MLKFGIEDFNKFFTKEKLLGSGAYGKVFLVTHKFTKKRYAMKLIEEKKNYYTVDEMEKEFSKEIETLIVQRHPNIAKLHFCFKNESKDPNESS